jgi:hypothetical protein
MGATIQWRVSEVDSTSSFRWGHSGDDLVAEWAGILSLRASKRGELQALSPAPGAARDLVEKTRLGVATAFLRSLRQEHSLHASAVAFQGKALVCVGASGLGKSTIAERMCRHAGVELLGDDVTAIDVLSNGGLQVVPSESAVWLTMNGSTEKAPVRSVPAASQAAELLYIVSLVFDDSARGPHVEDMRGGTAVSALLESLIRFEKTPDVWARELDFVGRLAQARVVQARRSRDVAPDTMAGALVELLVRGDR